MNVIQITDINAPELDIFARLSERELLNTCYESMFIAESPLVIDRALSAGYEPISVLIEQSQINKQGRIVLERLNNIPIYTSDLDILTQITGFKLTRGMLCAMKRKVLKPATELIENKHRIAVLENVMNPTNVGAIFRSAAALGIEAVLLTDSSSDPLYRRAIRVSMGTVFQVPWTKLTEKESVPENLAELLHSAGYRTAAMALSDNSVRIDNKEVCSESRLAIILGTEGEGLKNETITKCDYRVKIPMLNGVDSLNVAAASAVAFWQLCKY